jgi:hypothetical protein
VSGKERKDRIKCSLGFWILDFGSKEIIGDSFLLKRRCVASLRVASGCGIFVSKIGSKI